MRGGLACLVLRKFLLEIRNSCSENFLSIDALFNWKKQVELKILIMAHRCQICNKKIPKKYVFRGVGHQKMEHVPSFFILFFYLLPKIQYIWPPQACTVNKRDVIFGA